MANPPPFQPTAREEQQPAQTEPRYPPQYTGATVNMEGGLFAFSTDVACFGASAPAFIPTVFPDPSWDTPEWTCWSPHMAAPRRSYQLAADCDLVLERVVPGVVRGSWVVLELPHAAWRPFWVEHAFERSFTGFSLAGRATALRLRFPGDLSNLGVPPSGRAVETTPTLLGNELRAFQLRTTAVHVGSEPLRLAAVPDPAPVPAATQVELDGIARGLEVGRRVLLAGHDAATGEPASELATLSAVTHSAERTTLFFDAPLRRNYTRATLTLNANVVRATQGERVADEVLGSGDASVASQRFVLRRGPLAHTLDDPREALEVRVDGVPWRRGGSPLDAGPDDAVYFLGSEGGRAVITFGDGVHGRRLPSGEENVVASYRAGAGAAGNVAPGALTILRTQPAGVRAVRNPERAYDGTDGERDEALRAAGGAAVSLLDRVVSLRDHEAFVLALPGVAKARARSFWIGSRRVIHLTVADTRSEALGDDLRRRLLRELRAAGDPRAEYALAACERRGVRVRASVRVSETSRLGVVREAATRALREALAASRRSLAQPLFASDVVAALQGVDGVASVRLTALYLSLARYGDVPDEGAQTTARVHDVLGAPDVRQALRDGRLEVLPARLLVLDDDPAALDLTFHDQEPRR